MRIAHVISSLHPGGGGLPKSAVAMASALAEQGDEIALIFFSTSGEKALIDEAFAAFPGFERIQLIALRSKPLARLLPFAVFRALRAFAPDLVHTHGLWEPLLAWAQIYAGKNKLPYVISAHSMLHPWHAEHHRFPKWCLKNLLGWRKRWRQAAWVQVLNEGERDDWGRQGVDRTRRIPNGIFAGEDLATDCDAFPELSGGKFVLSLARLHAQKAPDLLLEAFVLLQVRHPDLHLILAGPDYGMAKDLKRMAAALGGRERIHFPGELKGERKWNALHQCSCFCLPSRAEGFSMALLEAAVAEAPIVMSANCYFDALAQAGGAIQADLTPEALALAMEKAMTRGDAMGKRARELVLADYSWRDIAKQYHKAYGACTE